MISPPDAVSSPSPAVRWAPTVFLALYFAVGWATLTPDHRWGDDWAQYVLHAANLASGHPYPDTGYVFNPDYPSVGPASYPPAVPLMLAPVIAVFGVNLVALKVVGLACIVLGLALAARVAAPFTGRTVAWVGVILLALHPAIWAQRQAIQSEAPYMFLSLLALWWGPRSPGEGNARAFATGLVLGLLVYLTFTARALGIALLPALVVFGWAQRRPLAWFAGLGVAFGALVALQSGFVVSPPTYRAELRAPTASAVSGRPWAYLLSLAEILPLPFGMAPVAAAAAVLATLVGIYYSMARVPPQGAGPRAHAARVPLAVWYLGAYASALALASVQSSSRLVLPLLPIVAPFAAYGVQQGFERWGGRARFVPAAAGGLVALYCVALLASGRLTPPEQMATCADCQAMFAFVKANSGPGDVVVFTKPRAMALFAGRRSWAPAAHYSPENLDRRLGQVGATLVVEPLPATEFAMRFPSSPAVVKRIRRPDAVEIYRNATFVVVRLGR